MNKQDKIRFLAPFKRGPGLYFAISPSQHSVPARSWRPACLCLCLCRGCTVCCWLPPVELYRPIFRFASQHDLCLLCNAVSRCFYDEACPILYRDVDLYNSTRRQLLLGLTILERPYLARMVRSLCLPCAILLGRSRKSHMEHDEYTQKLPDALTPALEAVIQLISLSIKDNER